MCKQYTVYSVYLAQTNAFEIIKFIRKIIELFFVVKFRINETEILFSSSQSNTINK